MLSRSLCIVLLIALIGPILLAAIGPLPPLAPVHPAWLLQDHLPHRLYTAATQPRPFGFGRRIRRRWVRRLRPQRPRETAQDSTGEEPLPEPPVTWPKGLVEVLDPACCRQVIRQIRREEGVTCPYCGGTDVEVLAGQLTSAGWQRYACLGCHTPQGHRQTFSDLTGLPWEGSHLSPAQLVLSLLAFVEGHSAEELARQIDVQPRIGQRLRRLYQIVLHMHRPDTPLEGEIEVDEVYIISGWKGRPAGRKPPRPPRRRRLKGKRGRGTWETDQVPLVAIIQRNGQVRLFIQRHLRKETFRPLLKRWMRRGAKVYTDDYEIYQFLNAAGYRHQTVNHSHGEYARGEVHVNTAEALFSLLRPYLATFRGVSKVYLPLYVAAFEFRYNHRHLTHWQQAGVLLRLLCKTDGPTVRQALRDNKVVELCGLPT